MVRGIIFDFDGLILDTEVPDYESWQELYRAHGHELEFDVWGRIIGTAEGSFDPVGHLETKLGRPLDREAIRPARRRRYLEMVHQQPILPGVLDYLSHGSALGLQLAVASSASRDWVHGHLNRLTLFDRFHAVRTRDDVARAKPDPDLYLAAVEALGLAPREAIAIEDSPNGALAAKRAGLFCVAVPNALTRQLPNEHADLTLDSLAALPLVALLDHVRERRS